jgi:ring-1,2-phenylacetyl-CoA epoxidase subunit PaaD
VVSGEAAAAAAREVVGAVEDPELPGLTIEDLGILRGVELTEDSEVVVYLTPTYLGCPAVEMIEQEVREALRRAGWAKVTLRRQLGPPWGSAEVNAEGRRKLAEIGVAPPSTPVCCPRCGSTEAELASPFSSTPCKALYRCRACEEPFERFKPL